MKTIVQFVIIRSSAVPYSNKSHVMSPIDSFLVSYAIKYIDIWLGSTSNNATSNDLSPDNDVRNSVQENTAYSCYWSYGHADVLLTYGDI